MARPKASLETIRGRLIEKSIPEPNTGCWLWEASHKPNGYGYMWAGTKKEHSHRLSYTLFKGPIPNGLNILHKCDQPACINPDHLFTGTQAENLQDCVRKGRHTKVALKGSTNPKAKLTDADIQEIRATPKRPRYLYDLATKFGVSRGTICSVKRGRSWGHVDDSL